MIIGYISGLYGLLGWLKFYSYTSPKENILTYSPLLIKRQQHWQKLDIVATKSQGKRLLVKINDIDTPEQARELIQCKLAITREALPTLNAGEYYWHDLIGLDVFNQAAMKIGTVTDIVETGANAVLVIKDDTKAKTLIPLLMDIYVNQVDLISKTIQVDWQIDIPT